MSKEIFRWLRDDFSDEIPEKMLSGEGDFKVRRNWWQGLISYLYLGIKKGIIDASLKSDVDQFTSEFTTDEFKRKPRTEKSDIDKANTLLDKILGRK